MSRMHPIRAISMALSVVALLLSSGAPAGAGVPTDQLKGSIERVLKTVDTLKGDAKAAERRVAVRKIANEIFDFPELAKRSLGRHWQGRTDKEREEFVALFSVLLERSYVSKIELYGGEKIVYATERVDGDQAVVGTKIVTKNGTEAPIDYRLNRRGERWLVYDVSIEGVSLVSNYRTQFNKIIQTSSYDELVRRLKAKQGEGDLEEEKASRGKAKSQ